MSFIETPRFPVDISYGSNGGPGYNTSIIQVTSGFENRNANWKQSRHEYDVAYGVKTQTQMYSLIEFFHSVAGMAYGFRYKDFSDFKSSMMQIGGITSDVDQEIGYGDGITTEYQILKTYTKGVLVRVRKITKPVAGTVAIAINSIPDLRWSVNTITGAVTFDLNLSYSIADAVSVGLTTVFTVASNAYSVGDGIFISGLTGSWAAMNSVRYSIISANSNTFTVNFDSSAYPPYSTNGGTTDTIPQLSEIVTAGFEFDVPCRFGSDKLPTMWDGYDQLSVSVPIVEIRL